MRKFIVVIAGPRAAGKTTAASHISNNLHGVRHSLTELRAVYEKRYQPTDEPWLSEFAPSAADAEAAIWETLTKLLQRSNVSVVVIEDIYHESELQKLQRIAAAHDRQPIYLYIFANLSVRLARHNRGRQLPIDRTSLDHTPDGDDAEYALATVAALFAGNGSTSINATWMDEEELKESALASVYAQIEPGTTLAE